MFSRAEREREREREREGEGAELKTARLSVASKFLVVTCSLTVSLTLTHTPIQSVSCSVLPRCIPLSVSPHFLSSRAYPFRSLVNFFSLSCLVLYHTSRLKTADSSWLLTDTFYQVLFFCFCCFNSSNSWSTSSQRADADLLVSRKLTSSGQEPLLVF